MEWTGSEAFLFSVQRAMPCEVSPALSGVLVERDEKSLHIRCYFDAAVSEADREFAAYLRDAVWADFFPTVWVEAEAISGLAPAEAEGLWAVQRTAALQPA